MTDNRTNEPTEAMILAGLNAYSSKGLENDGYETTEEYPSLEMWGDRFASQMRAALVAAQGAEPQTEKDIHEPNHDRVYCVRCGGNWPCQPAPALPSSGVDEDKLAEVIGRLDWGYMVDGPSVREIARAVAEWLKGQRDEQVGWV